MIHENILSTIGNTPTVKLNKIGSELECKLYVKCEFFNPGGSIKDRIGWKMVEDAEAEGRIKPGSKVSIYQVSLFHRSEGGRWQGG